MISVQQEDFDVAEVYRQIRHSAGDAGAIVTFTGLVREIYDAEAGNSGGRVTGLFLEHYAGMTEKSLRAIVDQAAERWDLLAIRVVHRVGALAPGDQIVLVATASAHRGDAFSAAEFIMDYLKSRAPFWKKQTSTQATEWVEARETDAEALKRW